MEDITFIGICGRTCSGKSSLCSKLASLDPENTIHIPVDKFCKVQAPSRYSGHNNWESPETLRFDKVIECLDNLKNGKPAYIPSKWCTEIFDKQVEPRKFVLIDGFLIYTNPDLVSRLDKKLFIDVFDQTIIQRRLNRKVNSSSEEYLKEVILPVSRQYDSMQKANADIIFNGNLSIEEVFLQVRSYLQL